MLNSKHETSGTLAVIGAGPKGISIAVKAKVLEEFGIPVARVILIEKHSVAAHWSGEAGYTNGELKLGTSPEKDVVFPLNTDVGDPSLNVKIRQRLMDFTWNSFLVQTDRYSDWVDRGKPAPCHQLWADYLKWVSAQLDPGTVIKAEVSQIEMEGDRSEKRSQKRLWKLSLRMPGNVDRTETLVADRLMVTGPGRTRLSFASSGIQGVYDLESFWFAVKKKTFRYEGRIAVVGAGENAASILLAFAKAAPELRVDVISPKGFVSTRSENFYENQIYSQPERNGWAALSLSDRLEFISRTDLGVFSVHAMQILNDEVRHRVIPGKVVALNSQGNSLVLSVEYHGKKTSHDYDQVILATGFDHSSVLRSLFSQSTLQKIENELDSPLNDQGLTPRMRTDLSVDGINPPLHLPMLAGVTQGPGFSNLSCLGSLSDRILLGDMAL